MSQLETPRYSAELDFAIDIARAAGALLLRYRERALSVTTKSSSSDPVSEADRDSESLVVDAIRTRFPLDSILGEEGASVEGSSGRQWIIDPLDGTVNYLYGRDEWAVSIALWDGDQPVVGVVYQPTTETCYAAGRGGGATRNGSVIRIATTQELGGCLIATGFAYEPRLRERQAAEIAALLPRVRDIRRGGSAALDLCSVADGRADVYFERFVRTWDVAAGHLVVEEAGGQVVSLASEAGYVGVIAGVAGTVEHVLSALARP
ncbi:inositol monophosphatase family protein [Glaciihabitans sp. UYNi722]|uniref:inositol monophosphatase family protein n=1 Tax=Glaciihabitans sp. UYNi722 TaxID=3156344 RepID=UPI00339A203F